jgi:predicted O-methyltransferase YrrM
MCPSDNAYTLLDMLTGYQAPAILMAAHRLGLFRALGTGPATLQDLAVTLSLPERSLGILLRALVALGLVLQEDGRYANGPLVGQMLVPGRPGYLGRLVDKEAFFYSAWSHLADCVREDRAAIPPIRERARQDPQTTHNFLLALDDIAALFGEMFVPSVELGDRRRLLDVGGGVGSYAVRLARRWPDLRVTILELPEVVPWAQQFVAEAGLADRIAVVPGDFLVGGFPSGHDVILFANIFHDQPPAVNQGLLVEAYRALPPGGQVLVYEFLLEENRVAPAASALFAVMMLVENEGGNVYTAHDIETWLAGAGFDDIATTPLPAPSPMGLIVGHKPLARAGGAVQASQR